MYYIWTNRQHCHAHSNPTNQITPKRVTHTFLTTYLKLTSHFAPMTILVNRYHTLAILSCITHSFLFFYRLYYSFTMAARPIPDALVQELRSLMAIHCREIVMTSKGDGLETAGQEELARKVFHGTEGYASILDAMMAGKGWYAPLFQRQELEVNRQNNEYRTDGFVMELLPMLHLNEELRYVLHDHGSTRKDLCMMKGTKNAQA